MSQPQRLFFKFTDNIFGSIRLKNMLILLKNGNFWKKKSGKHRYTYPLISPKMAQEFIFDIEFNEHMLN